MIQRYSQRTLILLAGLASATMLLMAFGFQYIAGLLPCAMCLWQRWPHAVAIGAAVIGVAIPSALVALLGAGSMLVNAGLALYHTGVERDWWEGPSSCTAGGGQALSDLSMDDLLNPDIGAELVLCDEVAWEMFGLSMASWNGLVCLALAALWIMAARTRPLA